jgi:mono/diheme cytochrome c family protein
MHAVIPAVLLASTVRTVGLVIAAAATLIVVVFAIVNLRAGRAEIGSEIELAPNRKPYLDDEQLEGRRLDGALAAGLVTLAVVSLGLPLYWLNEPGRQAGAEVDYSEIFVGRGESLFATTEDGGFNCAGCHGPGGTGGVAPFTLLDDEGEFIAQVTWQSPALNTVMLRHSEEEVIDVLVYGRPYSPMPAWGEAGGGPLTEQQLDNLIDYMYTITLSPEEARAEIEDELRSSLGLADDAPIDYGDLAVGEALFNLGRSSGFAGGAYSCGRCHTRGWSINQDTAEPEGVDLSEVVDYPDGSGAFGPSLRYPLVPQQFFTTEQLVDFITVGSEFGAAYGRNGQGSGHMPGFGENPNDDAEDDGMMTQEMIEAIVAYEMSFHTQDAEAGNGNDNDNDNDNDNGNGNGEG